METYLQYLFGGMLFITIGMFVYALIKESISEFKYYKAKYFKK